MAGAPTPQPRAAIPPAAAGVRGVEVFPGAREGELRPGRRERGRGQQADAAAADARRRARVGRRVSGAGSWTSGCGGSHAGGGRRAGREQRSRAPADGLGT